MRNSWLIAIREWKERVNSRSFVLLSILGPLVVLGLIYLLFAMGGQSKLHWKVLVADPANYYDQKMMPNADDNVTFYFADSYIESEEFADGKKYQEFDALLEINEKTISNKEVFVFYRETPPVRIKTKLKYYTERRMEEVMVQQLSKISIGEYRKIKQQMNIAYRDVYDPLQLSSNLTGWAGLFFGALIFVFIFLFGMTILRSVSREKSNRIVEVLLASVRPRQLMFGKIVGIGFAAFLQFTIWIFLIGTGLYLMRENIFPDMLDASNFNIQEMASGMGDASYQEQYFASREYNEFVELVYERLQYGNILGFFALFFIGGYLFYGALFAAIGSTMGTESDGQQFVIPLILLLCVSMYAGYYVLHNPNGQFSAILHYLPFTSPVVVMVKLTSGYAPGEGYQIIVSFLTLILSAFAMLAISGRLFKNGILQFGHRLKFRHLIKWLRKS